MLVVLLAAVSVLIAMISNAGGGCGKKRFAACLLFVDFYLLCLFLMMNGARGVVISISGGSVYFLILFLGLCILMLIRRR